MKMKVLSSLTLIYLLNISANAQNKIIEYQTKINNLESNNMLIIGDTVSFWIFANKSCDEAPIMLKNFKNETVDFSERLFNNTLYIRDSLHKMSWTIAKDTMTILKQLCQSATTEFRGRKYVAYFSTEDRISNGPWKFGGLPGVILYIKSIDGFLEMIAINSKYSEQPYKNKCTSSKSKFINWEEYKVKFITAMDSYIKLVKSNGMLKDNSTLNVKIDSPEIIYPKVQVGEGFIIR
jgi:hypothetical protein